MSAQVEAVMQAAADAASGALSSLRKRKIDGSEDEPEAKAFKTGGDMPSQTAGVVPPMSAAPPATAEDAPLQTNAEGVLLDPETGAPMTKAREVRLEQNRKAARESRRRKKVMIEELQRSVIFFSRANGTLKQQNDEITRLLMQAQAQVAAADGKPAAEVAAAPIKADATEQGNSNALQQVQAQAVATQAMYESQGFPAAAARAAAQTINSAPAAAPPVPMAAVAAAPSLAGSQPPLPPMQPGATMQAMANFQQAAAAAMQHAIQGMQGIPGVNMHQLAATPVGANPQQAYTDTMTALAMQQAAAAAAAGQQFVMQPGMHFMAHPMVWQQPAAPPAAVAAAPAAEAPATTEKQA